MQESEEPSDEELAALIEALGPPLGDVVVRVESHDHALLNALWGLQGEGVVVTETIQKAGFNPATVYLVLKDVGMGLGDIAIGLRVLKQILDLVKAHTKNKKKDAKTEVRARKDKAEIEKLLSAYKTAIEVKLTGQPEDEDSDGED